MSVVVAPTVDAAAMSIDLVALRPPSDAVACSSWVRPRPTSALRCPRDSSSPSEAATTHPSAPRRVPEDRHLVLARALARDAAVGVGLANVSAAAQHGLPIPDADLSRVQLGRPGVGASGSRASGVQLMHRNVDEDDLVFVDDVLATTAARTVADLARTAAPLTAIAAGDAALHRRLCSVDEIAAQLERGRHGSRRGLMLLRRMDAACESPAETAAGCSSSTRVCPSPHPAGHLRSVGDVPRSLRLPLRRDLIGSATGRASTSGATPNAASRRCSRRRSVDSSGSSTRADGWSAGVRARRATIPVGGWRGSLGPSAGDLATGRPPRPRDPAGETGPGWRGRRHRGRNGHIAGESRQMVATCGFRGGGGHVVLFRVVARQRSRGARHVARAAKGSGL